MGIPFRKSFYYFFTLFITALLIPLGSAQAATYFVDEATGSNTNSCLTAGAACATVQKAIELAMANANAEDTINVGPGEYSTTAEAMNFDTGGPQTKYTVVGAGFTQTFFDGGGGNNIVVVASGITLDLSGVTIQNGEAGGSSQGGGGLKNLGTTILHECVVKNNTSPDGDGAGIGNAGTMTITNCTINNNTSNRSGGGVSNGGAIAGAGGVGTLVMVNSTVSGNTTVGGDPISTGAAGGGIYNHTGSTLSLFNVTISKNTTNPALILGVLTPPNGGGGIFASPGTSPEVNDSIIAGNTDNSTLDTNDCSGDLSSTLGHNLVQDTNGCTFSGTTTGDKPGENPLLGDLQANGGNGLPTHALGTGSPAIDAGNSNGCKDQNGTNLGTDERGLGRPPDNASAGDTRCDMGAFEVQGGGGDDDDDDDNGGSCSLITQAMAGHAIPGWTLLILSGLGILTWRRKKL